MFQRLLVDKIEHRVLVGTVAFLGIMVVLGWIAINEAGRMRAFEQQFLARSIERGATLFASNCTSCHGKDGRGLTGVAPALNNPAFFGHNYFSEIDAEVTQLTAERGVEGTSAERITAIDARLAELDAQRTQLTTQIQAAIDKGYDVETPGRLQQLGWGAGLRPFVVTTLIHGRPTSGSYWPQPMAAWSQLANGPLRQDQIEDLTNYILNWDRGNNWTVEDLLAVNQFAKLPADPSLVTAGAGSGEPVVGTDVTAAETAIAELTGDPVNGQSLYAGALGCAGCHTGGAVGPATEGTWTRAVEVRVPETGAPSPEYYLIESIIAPNAYVVPNYQPLMPANFGERLNAQQLADLIAYLRSHDEPIQ